MRPLLSFIFLTGHFVYSYAQTNPIVHQATFKKGKVGMSSNQYKPDNWEKSYFDSSLKTAFPSDLTNHPDKYLNKLKC